MPKNTIKFTATIDEMIDSKVYNRHVKVLESIGENWKNDQKEKRIICTLNNKESYPSAILFKKSIGYFINVNKAVCKKIGANAGDSVSVEIVPDNSKYGMTLPEEMEELLSQDTEGSFHFHNLTPGKQRSLLYIIAKPKSSDIRLKKAIVTLNYLKSVAGKLDFKELNQAYKDANK